MGKTSEEIIIGIITFSLFVILFGLMMLMVIFGYVKRKRKLLLEKSLLESSFKQELLRAQLEIQEQTFDAISGEIHDNVGQILSLVKVQLNIIGETDKTDKLLVQEAKENISKAITDLRDMAKGLNSDKVQELGLHETLELEIERINRSHVLAINQLVIGNIRNLDGKKKLIIFRIIQESLQNILKHAKASEVDIVFQYSDEVINVSIGDNGQGFEAVENKVKRNGLGLSNMVKRTELIGGKIIINSKMGGGTIIQLIIPYE